MLLLAQIIGFAFNLYIWIIIAQIIVHWLIAFEVFKASSPQAQNLLETMRKATDPVYKPLRKYIPPIGGIDITPIIAIIGLSIIKNIIIGILI